MLVPTVAAGSVTVAACRAGVLARGCPCRVVSSVTEEADVSVWDKSAARYDRVLEPTVGANARSR